MKSLIMEAVLSFFRNNEERAIAIIFNAMIWLTHRNGGDPVWRANMKTTIERINKCVNYGTVAIGETMKAMEDSRVDEAESAKIHAATKRVIDAWSEGKPTPQKAS